MNNPRSLSVFLQNLFGWMVSWYNFHFLYCAVTAFHRPAAWWWRGGGGVSVPATADDTQPPSVTGTQAGRDEGDLYYNVPRLPGDL